MKKLAIGCGVIAVVLIVAAGAGIWYVTNKARGYLKQLEQIAAVDKRIANTSEFTPPPRGELTPEMVQRFAAAQDGMRARLGKRVDEISAKQDEFVRRQNAERRDASPLEAFTALKDLMGLILDAKNAQVDALNEQRFSMEEYLWVRRNVYAAAGVSVTELGLQNLEEAIKSGGASAGRTPEAMSDVPARNKELVAPLAPRFKDWAPIAFLGF